MTEIKFKTNWQYTPFLEGEELTDGTFIDLEYEGKLYENIKVGVITSFTDVHGVNLPKSTPFVTLPSKRKLELKSKNMKAQRTKHAQ